MRLHYHDTNQPPECKASRGRIKVTKSQRVQVSEVQRLSDKVSQLQGDKAMPILGIPPIVAAEPEHAHLEPTRNHVHARDEALALPILFHLKEKESSVAALTKFFRCLFAERDDLALRDDHPTGITERSEYLLERSI